MIYLDENEVTIKASKEAVVGEEYELNGKKYKVVDGPGITNDWDRQYLIIKNKPYISIEDIFEFK